MPQRLIMISNYFSKLALMSLVVADNGPLVAEFESRRSLYSFPLPGTYLHPDVDISV